MSFKTTLGLSRLAHTLSKATSLKGLRRFESALQQVERAQDDRLSTILQSVEGTRVADDYKLTKGLSLSAFRRKVPVTEYEHWSPYIEQQRMTGKPIMTHSPCDRFQPTSGSTSAMKWIPYSSAYLEELNQAISPWVWDLYRQFPDIGVGRHYWSLSWIPSSLRKQISGNINDDLKLLPLWKRLFMSAVMAVPDDVSKTESSDQSLFATLCYLAADQRLSMMSVWSPTFAINLLNGLSRYREPIAETLRAGRWSLFGNELSFLKAPKSSFGAHVLMDWNGRVDSMIVASLWPSLALISSWDTSSSALWAKQLRTLFPGVSFQGKGLWATEGVVTIPYQGKYPLAVNSHFYEFMDLHNNQLYTAWQLRKDQVVKPILTTGSGLLRYAMKDQIKVVDFIDQAPCFEFLGRMDGTDMVGEKVSGALANELLSQVSQRFPEIKPVCLVAIPATGNEQPTYLLLCDGKESKTNSEIHTCEVDVASMIESELAKNFHYQLARDLNQLGHARCVVVDDAWELYEARCRRRGMVTGNIKIEPLILWDDYIPDAFQPYCLTHTNREMAKDVVGV